MSMVHNSFSQVSHPLVINGGNQVLVANNIFSDAQGLFLDLGTFVRDVTVDHNLYTDDANPRFRRDAQALTLEQWRESGFDADSIVGDPQFVDSGTDLHIGAQSAALDRGALLEAFIVSSDIDGDFRPRGNGPDMGADERP
jgi:hypothetical protein